MGAVGNQNKRVFALNALYMVITLAVSFDYAGKPLNIVFIIILSLSSLCNL